MKLTQTFIGISSAALVLAGVVTTVHFVARAQDSAPAIRVESTPVDRDPRLGTSYAPIVKKAAPSVVNIYTTRFVKERVMGNPFFNDPLFRHFFGDQGEDSGSGVHVRTHKEQSLGSGVIVSPDGFILTANHVVAGADVVKVALSDSRREYTAKVIGRDEATDVAVLKINATDLHAITLADSDLLEVGDVVLAVGNPFGVGQTVTMGIVSALGRSGLGFEGYEDFIQTDAAINPGNSGGALVDAEGRLVGINTAIISPSGGNNGIGLAVPIDIARTVMNQLLKNGKITRGYLGILPEDVEQGEAQQFKLPDMNGALVGDVTSDSPAGKAGIQAGDVIEAINGKQVMGAENLKITVSLMEPGSKVDLKVIRNGSEMTVPVTLGKLPEQEADNSAPDTNSGTVAAPQLDLLDGVTVADIEPSIRRELRIPSDIHGALVSDVDHNSNAADGGLGRGDIILEINRQTVGSADEAIKLCHGAKGDQIVLKIWRRIGNFSGTRYLSVDNTKS